MFFGIKNFSVWPSLIESNTLFSLFPSFFSSLLNTILHVISVTFHFSESY